MIRIRFFLPGSQRLGLAWQMAAHPLCIIRLPRRILRGKGGISMKKDEKQPVDWEVKDPKPPVIRSGHMEDRKH